MPTSVTAAGILRREAAGGEEPAVGVFGPAGGRDALRSVSDGESFDREGDEGAYGASFALTFIFLYDINSQGLSK